MSFCIQMAYKEDPRIISSKNKEDLQHAKKVKQTLMHIYAVRNIGRKQS